MLPEMKGWRQLDLGPVGNEPPWRIFCEAAGTSGIIQAASNHRPKSQSGLRCIAHGPMSGSLVKPNTGQTVGVHGGHDPAQRGVRSMDPEMKYGSEKSNTCRRSPVTLMVAMMTSIQSL